MKSKFYDLEILSYKNLKKFLKFIWRNATLSHYRPESSTIKLLMIRNSRLRKRRIPPEDYMTAMLPYDSKS